MLHLTNHDAGVDVEGVEGLMADLVEFPHLTPGVLVGVVTGVGTFSGWIVTGFGNFSGWIVTGVGTLVPHTAS